jgi:phosphoglycerol transferase MdoB-like AlkP superfamily enzyme
MFGIPDVSPWQASAHNPLTVDQASIANAFTGYDKFYFLGGSANWSNIRGMLAHNLDGLHIYEEGSYKAPAVDVWGITDEELFLAANDVLRKEQKPFFALIHTSGNHRPYTVPKQTHGFKQYTVDLEALRANEFESNEEYNSFRYLDHAVGLFIQQASKEAYFKNTVFVLYGDHGTRTGAPGSDLAMGDLAQVVYHVPLIIYAPGFIKTPRRIDTPSSHVDILPTVASFCGVPYVNQTLGLDVLDPANAQKSIAFVFTTFHDPPDLEMIGQKGATTIIRSKDNSPSLGRALYEASRWLLYHNHG